MNEKQENTINSEKPKALSEIKMSSTKNITKTNRFTKFLWVVSHDPRISQLKALYHIDQNPTEQEKTHYQSAIEKLSPRYGFMQTINNKEINILFRVPIAAVTALTLLIRKVQAKFTALGSDMADYASGNSAHLAKANLTDLEKDSGEKANFLTRQKQFAEEYQQIQKDRVKALKSQDEKLVKELDGKSAESLIAAIKERDIYFADALNHDVTSPVVEEAIKIYHDQSSKLSIEQKMASVSRQFADPNFVSKLELNANKYSQINEYATFYNIHGNNINAKDQSNLYLDIFHDYTEVETEVPTDMTYTKEKTMAQIKQTGIREAQAFADPLKYAGNYETTTEATMNDGILETKDIDNSEYVNDFDEIINDDLEM